MHPSRYDIERFCEGLLADPDANTVEKHLSDCEFCRAIRADYEEFRQAVADAGDHDRDEIDAVARRLVGREPSNVISLAILPSQQRTGAAYLAADGTEPQKPDVENITTLYSEDPEVVVRVMRDRRAGGDYIQLIAEDTAAVANCLVQLTDLEREFLTDSKGRASVTGEPIDDYAAHQWQLKLPEAVFELQPLEQHRPDSLSGTSVLLETEQADRLRVTFDNDSAGSRISIEILELRGETDFAPVRAYVTSAHSTHVSEAAPRTRIPVDLDDTSDRIVIRLFH